MKTIKEIVAAFKAAETYETWMDDYQFDERNAVQKAIASFQKRMEKLEQVQKAHDEKLAFDASFLLNNHVYLAGTDEAGRGPLAGPVVTAAVILPNNCQALLGINDSKQLTKDKRNEYAKRIKEHALAYSIHFQSPEEIDRLNILEATRQSMEMSINTLSIQPDVVIADAMKLNVSVQQHSIIKGDAKSLAIAAASILAKTARDEYMDQLDEQFPMYGFKQHAGYGTKQHLEALEKYGVTIHHRKSFEPIKSMLKKE